MPAIAEIAKGKQIKSITLGISINPIVKSVATHIPVHQ
jgi:hypothetical protein